MKLTMHERYLSKILQYLFISSIILGVIFRFYNLNWGSPFYFHPDERNIASAVSQLRFPEQLNPHFFAYGSFPIYAIYFTGILFHERLTFDEAIVISRLYASLFSILTLILLYRIAKNYINKHIAMAITALAATSVGFIQYAHFGTFEMWLTFFSLLLFSSLLHYLKKKNIKSVLIIGIIIGLLAAIKTSSLPLILLPFLAIFFSYFARLVFIKQILFLIVVSFITFALVSPFVFLDFSSFLESMKYESEVALGTLPVFYTGEFFGTIPVLYQFIHTYPFLLNPVIAILFIPALCYVTYIGVKQRNPVYYLLFAFYYLLFLSQAFLFAKWTRYMVPTIPFIYIIIGAVLSKFNYYRIIAICFISINITFALAFVLSVHANFDTRVAASLWAREHIPTNAPILSEVYDLGILPFNQLSSRIALFNFYDLDETSYKSNQLYSQLRQYDYIILPSPRILKSRLTKPPRFPYGNNFYQALLQGKLGFEKVYETPCDIFCKITYLGDPVFRFEQTANVFDRPTLFIFKRNNF